MSKTQLGKTNSIFQAVSLLVLDGEANGGEIAMFN